MTMALEWLKVFWRQITEKKTLQWKMQLRKMKSSSKCSHDKSKNKNRVYAVDNKMIASRTKLINKTFLQMT